MEDEGIDRLATATNRSADSSRRSRSKRTRRSSTSSGRRLASRSDTASGVSEKDAVYIECAERCR